MAIMTASEARLYVRGITGTGEDSNLDTLISRADAVFASYLGLPPASAGAAASLEDQTITLYMDGPGGQELRLPYAPVLSITSIHDSDDRLYSSADLVAASDYELYGDESLIRLTDTSSHGFWSTTRRAIKVAAVIGFSTIPEDIKHAAGLQVAHWFQGRDHVGRKSVSQGGGSITVMGLELLPEVRQALNPYRQAGAIWVG